MPAAITFSKSSVSKLFDFAKERYLIYVRRADGDPKPWTKDPILQRYRFCNVYRELDTVTRWVTKNIRTPYEHDPNLWFMLSIARQINLIDTLSELKFPVRRYNARGVKAVLRSRTERGLRAYTGAYMLNCNWHPDWKGDRDKATFTTDLVLQSVWDARKGFPYGGTLADVAAFLEKGHGWGGFTAAQVVADLKYATPWRDAPDWWTFARSGPGSRRGMAIVAGKEARNEEEWKTWLEVLRREFNDRWVFADQLHAQDFQNVLCEYHKYVKGHSRSRYDGN